MATCWRMPDADDSEKQSPQYDGFGEDLAVWVEEVGERINWRVLFIEVIGQIMFTCLGPFSLPIIYYLYGSVVGLQNRGFVPGNKSSPVFFRLAVVTWTSLASSCTLYIIYRPQAIKLIELKLLALSIFTRNIVVAIKYAYMSPSAWEKLQTQYVDTKYFDATLIVRAWFNIPVSVMMLQTELSFIEILGSRQQRKGMWLKFVGWPKSTEEIRAFRHKVDLTSRTLYFRPTGGIAGVGRRTALKVPVAQGTQLLDVGEVCIGKRVYSMPSASWADMKTVPNEGTQRQQSNNFEEEWEQSGQAGDISVFKLAAEGYSVSLEDLFIYILRGLLKSEAARVPKKFIAHAIFWYSVVLAVFPAVFRASFGGEEQNTTVVWSIAVGVWPLAWLSYFGTFSFIVIGGLDMWRRRALLRSCAALLSVQWYYREDAPAEVDALPIIDLADAHTIEAWRKLRQLCQSWGSFYSNRIRAFAGIYAICILLFWFDMLGSMQAEAYLEFAAIGIFDLIMYTLMGGTVMFCIVVLAYLGNEVNGATARHTALLQRQRTLLLSDRTLVQEHDAGAERAFNCAEFLDVLCEDIEAEHPFRAAKLLGMDCDFTLLSAMYVIPVFIGTSMFSFCTSDATADRCVSYITH